MPLVSHSCCYCRANYRYNDVCSALISDGMYDSCNKIRGAGVYLWMAGYRRDPTSSEFVWQLYTKRSQYGGYHDHNVTRSEMKYTYWRLGQPDNNFGAI